VDGEFVQWQCSSECNYISELNPWPCSHIAHTVKRDLLRPLHFPLSASTMQEMPLQRSKIQLLVSYRQAYAPEPPIIVTSQTIKLHLQNKS
jgi:hypothetical protein